MDIAQYYVKVTNKNDIDIDDRFEGKRYVFPAGKSVSIPYEVACHIFEIEHPEELKDKDRLLKTLCRRWGWNTPHMIKEKENLKMFANIQVVLVTYKVVREEMTADSGMLPPSRAVSDESFEEIMEDEDEGSTFEETVNPVVPPKKGPPKGWKKSAGVKKKKKVLKPKKAVQPDFVELEAEQESELMDEETRAA